MLRPLGDFLDRAIQKTGAKRSIDAAVIVESAGPIMLQVVPALKPVDFKVVSYRDGLLTIAVVHPAVGQEIRFHLESLLEVFREMFEGHRIERLRFIPLIEQEDEW